MAGKPNSVVGPQAGVVETGRFAERIITAAVGIAGHVIQKLEFAKDGEVGAAAERALSSGKVAILRRSRYLRRAWESKESGRIML
jgi:hypothetical protein